MWLIVPETSCPSAQESADSNSELVSLSTISERLVASSVQWKGKPLLSPAWSRRWKQGGFIRRLSGLTLPHSTLEVGVDSFISSLRATHAKTTPTPETEPVPMESDSSPPKCVALPKSAGLILSSERTSRGTLTDSSMPSSHHWKGWATALRREYSARPKLEIPCSASDCSSWPSAKTVAGSWERDRNGNVYQTLEGAAKNWATPSDISKRGGSQSPEKRSVGGHTINLEDQAEHWEGPSVAVTEGTRLTRGGNRSNELLLTGQAMKGSENWTAPSATDSGRGGVITPAMTGASLTQQVGSWPGPAERDYKGVNSIAHVTENSTGSMHLDQLPNFVEHCFHPPSSPDQPIAGGAMSSTDSPNTNQPSAKRKLNPIFVEALMRWPTGLSGFERPEMALIRWSQLQLSYLSALYSQEPKQVQGDLF